MNGLNLLSEPIPRENLGNLISMFGPHPGRRRQGGTNGQADGDCLTDNR